MTTRTAAADLVLLSPTEADRHALDRVLADAAFPPSGDRPADPLAEILAVPDLARYRWQVGTVGLVARDATDVVGAAWLHRFGSGAPGYGFVAADVPELTVAVRAGHRGTGVGRMLVTGILDLAAAAGADRVSLSVAPHNEAAISLYRSLGFRDAGGAGGSLTMVATTAPTPPAARGGIPPAARAAHAGDGPALVRLRQVMFDALDQGGDHTWHQGFLAHWAGRSASGRSVGAVVDGPDGRPIGSALADLEDAPPAPGRPTGADALVYSVATEPAWRGRGVATATVALVQSLLLHKGVTSAHLAATTDGQGIYRQQGFVDRPTARMRWTAAGS